jgi:hypothetical protein
MRLSPSIAHFLELIQVISAFIRPNSDLRAWAPDRALEEIPHIEAEIDNQRVQRHRLRDNRYGNLHLTQLYQDLIIEGLGSSPSKLAFGEYTAYIHKPQQLNHKTHQ